MSQKREYSIHIHEDTPDFQALLRAELAYLTQYFRGLGHERCELVFGWAWGMDYPPGEPWKTFLVPLSDLEAEVSKPQDAGYGEFGRDDVTVTVPPWDGEVLFCHHGGIHLTFAEPAPEAEAFRSRWLEAGFEVEMRDIPEEGASRSQ